MAMPKIGAKAPDFTLPDENGKKHSLSDYKGKWVLLYFYPKDDTTGCTKEACVIRDNLPDFLDANADVLGVSVDSVASHKKFGGKYDLNFPILADENKEVVKKYGVWGKKTFMGRGYTGTNRVSFLINPEGKIFKIYDKVKPALHAEEVLADLKAGSKKKL